MIPNWPLSTASRCRSTSSRGPRCQRFRGEAAYGHDHPTHLLFYSFRPHARLCWPGALCQIELTPGNGQELAAAEGLTADPVSVVLGDRKQDPWPRLSRDLSRWRYRIDTLFGQLVERTAIKRIWAHDLWHLADRLLRSMLMHTLAVYTNVALERPPLHFADLVT